MLSLTARFYPTSRLAVALALCLALPACLRHSSKLVDIHVNNAEGEHWQTLVADFQELERTGRLEIEPRESTARYRVVSGGSVNSAIFPLAGACRILLMRGQPLMAFLPPPAGLEPGWEMVRLAFARDFKEFHARYPQHKFQMFTDDGEDSPVMTSLECRFYASSR